MNSRTDLSHRAEALEPARSSPGDADAADAIHRTLAGMLPELVGYFLRRLGDPDDAADAAADALVILLGKRHSLPTGLEEMRRYSYGVAHKVLLRARRGRVRRTELATRLRAELPDAVPPPSIADDRLVRALARLHEKDRELLLLVAWEGFGVAEAGALLGLRAESARKRYSRVRARLRAELSGENEQRENA